MEGESEIELYIADYVNRNCTMTSRGAWKGAWWFVVQILKLSWFVRHKKKWEVSVQELLYVTWMMCEYACVDKPKILEWVYSELPELSREVLWQIAYVSLQNRSDLTF